MTTTLVLPGAVADELAHAVSGVVETGGVLLARYTQAPSGDVRLLGHAVHWVSESAYRVRSATEMVVASEGFVPALAAAEACESVAIWIHTHPGANSSPKPSARDHVVNSQLADLFRLRSGSPWYGALVISSAGEGIAFAGHIETEDARSDIDRLWTTGPRLALVQNWSHVATPADEMFDRSIRAFGGAIQSALARLRVSVVGCGGTGSAVIEQIVRLGVRNLELFDPKTLTRSNVTRVYGSTPLDIGKAKVDIAAAHVARIAPDAKVKAHLAPITHEATARHLPDADVIFGCTDDNAGRLVLSRIAAYFMIPVIDCGVVLSSNDAGQIEGIDGRVTLLGPGAPCLVCRGRIDLRRAAAEALPRDEYERLAAEGYAPGLPDIEPAVVAYTTQVAASAVSELLERFVHYGPTPAPNEILLRMHERELSYNRETPRPGHYCDPNAGKLGRGMTEPFLEQLWQS